MVSQDQGLPNDSEAADKRDRMSVMAGRPITAYAVRTLVLASGERLPVLVDRTLGQPLFQPTVYTLTELRARNRASGTIEQALRALEVLYLFLDIARIDLPTRLDEGKFLELGEIDELVRLCRMLEAIAAMSPRGEEGTTLSAAVTSLEKVRARPQRAPKEVDRKCAGDRVRSIRDHLAWLLAGRLLRFKLSDPAYSTQEAAGGRLITLLNARIPSSRGRSTIGKREGTSPETTARLLQVIDPASPENPWRNWHARKRNALALHWLGELGLRRGELLGVRISAVDFRRNLVLITRRADDPKDPRRRQPDAKTRDREVPLSPGLIQMTEDYIIDVRRALKGARKHDFLFVASGAGAPMSLIALNKVFKVLRLRVPELPSTLSPHVMRHTWNDRFAEHMDRIGASEDWEKKMRAYLMGWSETSDTAATYTRRHIRNKARVASLKMQDEMLRGLKNGS